MLSGLQIENVPDSIAAKIHLKHIAYNRTTVEK